MASESDEGVHAQRSGPAPPREWSVGLAGFLSAAALLWAAGMSIGDGQLTDYDEWTLELEPTKPELVAKFISKGALKPRNIHPRNLRLGVYRGGRRPVDLYLRLRNGIDGTPMPAVPMLPAGAKPGAKGFSEADLWSLIDFVRNLPYESISNPRMAQPKPVNQRERS